MVKNFYCCFTSAFTFTDIILYKFLNLHSTLSEKIFVTNLPSTQTHQNLLSMTPNFFCWCSLKGWHQLQQQTSIATFKQLYPIEMWWCCLKKIPVYSSRFQPLPHGKLKIILQLILQVILIHNFIIHIFDRLWWLYSTFLITGYGTASLS